MRYPHVVLLATMIVGSAAVAGDPVHLEEMGKPLTWGRAGGRHFTEIPVSGSVVRRQLSMATNQGGGDVPAYQ